MTTILPKTKDQQATLQICMPGSTGDLIATCHAIAEALAVVENPESRIALTKLLKAMLPTEKQVSEINT